MKINFEAIPETVIHQMRGGEKDTIVRMVNDGCNKIMHGLLEPGASIGMHTHETNSEIIYILAGTGSVLFDDACESLTKGECHYCPKGCAHSLRNDGAQNLVFFAVVPEQ